MFFSLSRYRFLQAAIFSTLVQQQKKRIKQVTLKFIVKVKLKSTNHIYDLWLTLLNLQGTLHVRVAYSHNMSYVGPILFIITYFTNVLFTSTHSLSGRAWLELLGFESNPMFLSLSLFSFLLVSNLLQGGLVCLYGVGWWVIKCDMKVIYPQPLFMHIISREKIFICAININLLFCSRNHSEKSPINSLYKREITVPNANDGQIHG